MYGYYYEIWFLSLRYLKMIILAFLNEKNNMIIILKNDKRSNTNNQFIFNTKKPYLLGFSFM